MTKTKIPSFTQSERLTFEMETEAGPATLTVTVQTATLAAAWRRQDYRDQLAEEIDLVDGWADLTLAQRRRGLFHHSLGANMAGVVSLSYRNGTGKEEEIPVTMETVEGLPEAAIDRIGAAIYRLNPHWAPVIPTADDEEDQADPADPKS